MFGRETKTYKTMENIKKPWNDENAPMEKNALKWTIRVAVIIMAGVIIGMLTWAAMSAH